MGFVQAREAVNLRAQMENRIAQNKKEEKEKEMREMALRARYRPIARPPVHGEFIELGF